jgi:hypothetical protein
MASHDQAHWSRYRSFIWDIYYVRRRDIYGRIKISTELSDLRSVIENPLEIRNPLTLRLSDDECPRFAKRDRESKHVDR